MVGKHVPDTHFASSCMACAVSRSCGSAATARAGPVPASEGASAMGAFLVLQALIVLHRNLI